MLWETLSAARDIGRLHEIATVLIRWGFGDVVRRIGLSSVLKKAGKVLHVEDVQSLAELGPPERVCRALEDLGPTFVKLGQMLATRIDLLGPEWIAAFEKLQDQVPALAYEKIEAQLTEDLGQSPDQIFPYLDKKAFAAASIAQVHRAQLVDGSEVILKIRRPNIVKRIEADLRLLARLGDVAEKNIPELARFKPIEIVRQFSQSLHRELDLAGECRYAERIAANLTSETYCVVPKVYWEWTSERLNVQEFIDGIAGRELQTLDDHGYDRALLAKRGAFLVLKMILEDGFFHADPHLGNLLALPGNRIAFIDFGMVGRLSTVRREQITDLLFAVVNKDTSGVISVLDEWMYDKVLNEEALAVEVDTFLDHYHGLALKQLNLSAVLIDLATLLREHSLSLPPDLALLFKTFITLDGVGRRLDPEFNIVNEAAPYLSRIVSARYSPQAILKRSFGNMRDTVNLVSGLPRDIHGLIKSVRRGGIPVHVDVTRLDHFGHQMDKAASRLTIGIVVAALIVGTAIVSGAEQGPRVMGLPTWGFVGFIVAALGGVWLLVSAWRSGKE